MNYIKTLVSVLCLSFLTMNVFAKDNLQRIVFTPQWIPQAQFAGYYAAKELGYYEELGLDVVINHPTASMYAVEMLETGKSDIVTSMLIDAIRSVDKGFDTSNIMQLMPRSTMTIISHQPINGDIETLRGKKISRWKAGFSTVVIAIFKEKGIDVEWIKYLSGVNLFLSKSVDASTAMSYNEIQTIEETGYDVKESHILRVSDLGYNLPEDGLYTTAAFAKIHPEAVQKFREASIRGWKWVRENREEAVDIVLKIAEESLIPTNKYHQTRMLDAIMEAGIAAEGEDYNLMQKDFEDTCELLYRSELIMSRPSFDSFVINGTK